MYRTHKRSLCMYIVVYLDKDYRITPKNPKKKLCVLRDSVKALGMCEENNIVVYLDKEYRIKPKILKKIMCLKRQCQSTGHVRRK